METLKRGETLSCNFYNILVATNYEACTEMEVFFKSKGYDTLYLGSSVQGEAREVANVIGGIGRISSGAPCSPRSRCIASRASPRKYARTSSGAVGAEFMKSPSARSGDLTGRGRHLAASEQRTARPRRTAYRCGRGRRVRHDGALRGSPPDSVVCQNPALEAEGVRDVVCPR